MDGTDNIHPSMIKLKSAEGHEFFVDKRCAMVSGTIKSMLAGQFAESCREVRGRFCEPACLVREVGVMRLDPDFFKI